MAQKLSSNVDKAAILLKRLAPQSLAKVLEMVGPENSNRLRSAIDAVSKRPDLAELTEQVLQEFRELQQEVRAAVGTSSTSRPARSDNDIAAQSNSAGIGSNPEATADSKRQQAASPSSLPTSEPLRVLLNTPPAILATVLQRETPRVMAIILKQLPTEAAGNVLEQLPAEQRQTTFMLLADKSSVNAAVAEGVVRAVADVCRTIDPASAGQQDSRFKTLTGILQSVEREERIRLLEALTEHDQELAGQIDDCLYDYADVLRIQDRSVQKLLSQLEQKVVALALKTAPEDVQQKIMRNLSERVRAALIEEMELLGSVPNSKAEQARREIANAIRAQDKDGSLAWIE